LILLALAVVLLLATMLVRPAYRYFAASESPDQLRFLLNLPDTPVPEAVAVSPDGSSIAYAARDAGSSSIFVRSIDALATRKLPGTEGAGRLFWSPNGRSLAFFAGGQLKRVDVIAGTTHNICETSDLLGGSWNSSDVILFASSNGLQRVPAAGGQPVALSTAGVSEKGGQREPHFLPDGRHYLYLSGTPGKDAAIYGGELDSTSAVRVVETNSNPVYAAPGYLLYHREGTLYAQPFKASSLSLSGEPIRIADKIPFSETGAGAFAASQTGILIFRNTPPPPPVVGGRGAATVGEAPLVWVDGSGKTIQRLGEEAAWLGVDLAPDGKRAAVHRHDGEGGDVWIFEPGLANPTKLTFDASQDNSSPIWSPDGKIAFGSRRSGKWGLYMKLADNTGGEKLLQESESPIVPMSWSRDGKVLVYTTSGSKTAGDIWTLSLTGEKAEAAPFLQSTADERNPQLSPDGRWIAYSSNSSSRSEIYIRPFPSGPGLIQVSVNGGVFPRWRGDGKALYFMSLVSLGNLMVVDLNVRGAEIAKAADPSVVFQTGFLDSAHTGGNSHAYAVAANGQRFLLSHIENAETSTSFRVGRGNTIPPAIQRAIVTAYIDRHAAQSAAVSSTAPINVVLNWTSSLHK
jgi:Tol biopolymer transport system component